MRAVSVGSTSGQKAADQRGKSNRLAYVQRDIVEISIAHGVFLRNGDRNLVLAKRSPELLRDLQCDIPMPVPPGPQVPVLSVCDRLKKQ